MELLAKEVEEEAAYLIFFFLRTQTAAQASKSMKAWPHAGQEGCNIRLRTTLTIAAGIPPVANDISREFDSVMAPSCRACLFDL